MQIGRQGVGPSSERSAIPVLSGELARPTENASPTTSFGRSFSAMVNDGPLGGFGHAAVERRPGALLQHERAAHPVTNSVLLVLRAAVFFDTLLTEFHMKPFIRDDAVDGFLHELGNQIVNFLERFVGAEFTGDVVRGDALDRVVAGGVTLIDPLDPFGFELVVVNCVDAELR